jgi:hypothetical protein
MSANLRRTNNTTQYFVSLYDFSVLAESETMPVLAPYNLFSANCNKLELIYNNFDLFFLNT